MIHDVIVSKLDKPLSAKVGLCLFVIGSLATAATARDDAGVKQFFLQQSNMVVRESHYPHNSDVGVRPMRVRLARRSSEKPLRRLASTQVADARSLTVHALNAHVATGQGGMLSIYNDPTLRAGDAIMTGRGLRVFRGSDNFPYRAEDFTTVLAAEGLDAKLRQALNATERGQTLSRLAHL